MYLRLQFLGGYKNINKKSLPTAVAENCVNLKYDINVNYSYIVAKQCTP